MPIKNQNPNKSQTIHQTSNINQTKRLLSAEAPFTPLPLTMAPRTRALAVLLSRCSLCLSVSYSKASAFSVAWQLHHLPSRSITSSSLHPKFHNKLHRLPIATTQVLSSQLSIRGGSTDSIRCDTTTLGESTSDSDDEARTGWLHNTEPKYYTPAESSSDSR